MKCNKNADALLFLLLFMGQREKILKKHCLRAQALKKGGEQRILGALYCNIII